MARISIAGRARYGDAWIPITARCAFDKGRLAALSLEVAPTPRPRLDLSGIRPLPAALAPPDATSRAPSLSSPQADSADPSGSSTITPTLQQTPSNAPPAIEKDQDFMRDHWFGFELQKPF
jgi:hypothetical protein